MVTLFPGPVTAVQVGTYFVGNYYSLLQQQPAFVHQFYNETSTLLRLDGARIDSAAGLMQIHNLLMYLNYTVHEITAANSLESWNGGVLVMVRGLLQIRDSIDRRRFVQTFFLAPQEKGYFVLNDILYFLEGEQMHQHPAAILAHTNYPTNMIASNLIPASVSNYVLGEGTHAREFAAPVPVQETSTVENYSLAEPPLQVAESAEKFNETSVEELTASLANITNVVQDHPTSPAEGQIGEPIKHTYASILRVAKVEPQQSVSPDGSLTAPLSSEWQSAPQAAAKQSRFISTLGPDKSEAVEESAALEEEGESRSVYVGNVSPSITTSEIEEEFKNFGKIRPDGVSIRSRKETGVHYAFVEYEEAISVQNALKGSPVQINGQLLHVEGRRPNNGTYRGRRGGRGRGGYQSDAPRGRFGGRSSGRGSSEGQENGERDYKSRARGNGYLRKERGILGNHNMRN